jgi:hypothetical protein
MIHLSNFDTKLSKAEKGTIRWNALSHEATELVFSRSELEFMRSATCNHPTAIIIENPPVIFVSVVTFVLNCPIRPPPVASRSTKSAEHLANGLRKSRLGATRART